MNILLVDDDDKSRLPVAKYLTRAGHSVTECAGGEAALDVFSTGDFPLVLTDVWMPGMSGTDLLRTITCLPSGPDTAVVMFTGHGTVESAVEALRMGAFDYLLKPINIKELDVIIDKVAEHQALRRENRRLTARFADEVAAATEESRQEVLRLRKLVARYYEIDSLGVFSEKMRAIVRQAQRFHADRTIPVLIQGETGTGKELIAKVIHFGDMEAAAPFVDVNCAAITPSLFESELFGYESGSFTGGLAKGQKGKLDLAAGGTLFLDEIGELPLDMQAKLLRVLQEKEFYRVGGLKKVKADVRIICATNLDLKKSVEAGKFRADLYYRLNVGAIHIPSLRQRREDILPLARLFLAKFARRRGKQFKSVGKKAAQLLLSYQWPGNVRELMNEIELAVFTYDAPQLEPYHLTIGGADVQGSRQTRPGADGGCGRLPFELPSDRLDLDRHIDQIITAALAKHGGNISATARYLGVSRRSLGYRVDKIQSSEASRTKTDTI